MHKDLSKIVLISLLSLSIAAFSRNSFASAPTSGTSEASSSDKPSSIPSELASPWTTDARPWLIGGVAATTLLLLLEDHISDPLQRDAASDKPLGSFSKFGNYGGQLIPNAAYSLGMLAHGFFAKDPHSLELSAIMFKASLYSVSLTTALKEVVREPRPGNASDKKSFPSGHSTAAFAFASVVAIEHPLPYGIAAFSLATLTGLSRINDNQHYLHDVVAGATIGISYGLGVALLHRPSPSKSNGSTYPRSLAFLPIYESSAKGACLVTEF